MAPPTTEPMRWWDIEQVAALETVLFPTDSPWTPAMFWAELAAGHHYVVVRGLGGEVDGYAGLARSMDEAEVQTIGVRPERQGAGLGRVLFTDLLTAAGHHLGERSDGGTHLGERSDGGSHLGERSDGGCHRILLDVRTDNAAAIGLYESSGFTRIGLRRRYYQPSGADAYTMERRA